MADHSILAPSSYGRLAHCRAAPTMEYEYPGEDTEASREGALAHAVALGIATRAPALPEHPEEMAQAVEMYLDDIASTLGANWRERVVWEQRVDLDNLHPKAFGTPDAMAQFPKFIYVWDFKYGHGYVDAFENWQMIGYVSKLVENLSAEDEADTTITFTIVQPRNFHPDGPVRRWVVKAWELRPYINSLKGWLAEAMQPDVKASPHPSACQHCSARSHCVSLRAAVYEVMDYTRERQALALKPEQLGVELARVQDAAALLKAYATGLEEEVEGALRHGVPVANYTMAPGKSVLQWNVPPELLADFGESIWAPRKPITPTQARDRKLIPAELLDAYASRPAAPLALTRVNHNLAKKVFKS